MKLYIHVRNCTPVILVESHLHVPVTFRYIKRLTRVRNPTSVILVESQVIQVRNLIPVLLVESHSHNPVLLRYTKLHIHMRNLMPVLRVESYLHNPELLRHMKWVTPVLLVESTTSSNLKVHEIIHSGKKLHTCDTCGKSFAQPSTLSTHKKTRTGEKPHPCDTCEKSLVPSNNLKAREITHRWDITHLWYTVIHMLQWFYGTWNNSQPVTIRTPVLPQSLQLLHRTRVCDVWKIIHVVQ